MLLASNVTKAVVTIQNSDGIESSTLGSYCVKKKNTDSAIAPKMIMRSVDTRPSGLRSLLRLNSRPNQRESVLLSVTGVSAKLKQSLQR